MEETDHSKAIEDDPLALCLSPPSHRPKPPTPLPPLVPPSPGTPQPYSPPPPAHLLVPDFISIPATASSTATTANLPARPVRARRNPSQAPRGAHKSDTVPPPFSWATDRRATVHSLSHLLSQNITNITGEAQCKRCEASQVISYDLVSKFNEVAAFIRTRKHLMHDRAPAEWRSPAFPDCRSCVQPNSMRPVSMTEGGRPVFFVDNGGGGGRPKFQRTPEWRRAATGPKEEEEEEASEGQGGWRRGGGVEGDWRRRSSTVGIAEEGSRVGRGGGGLIGFRRCL